MDAIRGFYVNDKDGSDIAQLYGKDVENVIKALRLSDAPAFIVKRISELYRREFWDLWSEIKEERAVLWGEQNGRRLTESWQFMAPDKRNNKARVTLRRYMALAANRELRRKVFGF